MTDTPYKRPIRSFVRREGRLTRGQTRALAELWPHWGIDLDAVALPLDLDTAFARQAPRVLEIGFGNGETLAELAARNPDVDYLGIEVHRPGVGHLLLAIESRGLANVRIVCADALAVLETGLRPGSLSGLNVFFPDPWPKKRHHKRRLVQKPFLDSAARALKPGGHLHVATDWENYAEHMLEALNEHPQFENTVSGTDLSTAAVPRPESRPVTKFERRGRRLGHGVWDLVFARVRY